MSVDSALAAPAELAVALTGPLTPVHPADHLPGWWRSAVIYQVYPRSFRDLNGDGVGDLAGITAELPKLAELDIDAVWLSPFYRSPQRDAGYDVSDYCEVDPLFGTLADFDAMMAEATRLGLRMIVDLVPNHCSDQHAAFQAALAAPAGSPERDMFIFRDGRGQYGEEPPNNWESHFGGPAWTRIAEPDGTPGQWYLHLFDTSQPDFNWDNDAVHEEFERVLRFWLDRGVAGFRVDVAHALVKAPGLPGMGRPRRRQQLRRLPRPRRPDVRPARPARHLPQMAADPRRIRPGPHPVRRSERGSAPPPGRLGPAG